MKSLPLMLFTPLPHENTENDDNYFNVDDIEGNCDGIEDDLHGVIPIHQQSIEPITDAKVLDGAAVV